MADADSSFFAEPVEKFCRGCKKWMSIDDFGSQWLRNRGRKVRQYRCKACRTKWNREYKEQNLEQERKKWQRWSLRRRFGLSIADYEAMVEFQNNLCAICGKPETKQQGGLVYRLAVDHDHATGKVRGLLCNRCNYMLGKARDDIGILENAIAYLIVHRGA